MKVSAAQNLPFGDGPDPRYSDLPRYLLDAGLARIRGRNPPVTPWWRRYVAGWQRFEPARRPPGGSPEPLIYGLAAVWNEDDVVYATVRNLLIQGADDVFVIDDASDDDTVSEAKAAGATVIHDPSDGTFDERRRSERISQVMDERTAAAGRPVWWIVVDADEFPEGPDGTTIRELVRTLPSRVDTVGSRVLEHYPGLGSAPKPRHHPLDELRNARWHDNPACPAGHWKHQVLRLPEPGAFRFLPGRHAVAAPPLGRPVIESTASLLMHHFPLRDRERTVRKLSAAEAGRYAGSDPFSRRRLETRLRMIDLAYQERYRLLPNMFPGEPKTGTSVRDWHDLVGFAERATRHQAGIPL
jgi:Glycosyl transferase family 2